MNTPEFTDEELYLIERLMDIQYSQLDRRCIETMEVITRAIAMGKQDLPDKAIRDANDNLMSLFDSAQIHKKISRKCEAYRKNTSPMAQCYDSEFERSKP
jgi:hypothetical protein